MKYIVYLTTNLSNNKIYIGVHGTENPDIFDGYIGNSINIFESNPELKHPKIPFHKAVKKYGYSSFRRQTIAVFPSEEEALELEAFIVNQEFIEREDTYNVTLGGGMPPLHNKQVYQYSLKGDFIKEWGSLTMAAEQYNTSGNILGISAKYKRTSIGYLWSFSKYDKLDISEYHIYNPKIPVYLYGQDKKYIKSYTSMAECYKDLQVSLSTVQRAVGLGNSINNYYLSTTLSSEFIPPKINNVKGEIHQYSLKGEYIKSYQNKEQLGEYNEYEINRAIKQGRTYKGYIWIRGEKLNRVPSKEGVVNKRKKIGQYTLDGTLVRVFDTLRECRKCFPNVSKVLRGQAKHCHNYTFKYIE